MTEYPDHIAIARKLLDRQGEINALTERAEKAEALLQALGWEKCAPCGNWVEPLGMVLHFRAEHATAETLAESTPASTGPFEGAEIGIGEDGTFAWRCGGGQGCKGWVGLGLSSEDAAWAEFRGHVSREHASAGEEQR